MSEKTRTRASAIRVLIIDDHKSVLWGLERLIESEKPRMTVAGKADSGARGIQLAEQLKPDVILLDIALGNENGLDSIATLLAKCSARIVVLTGVRDPAMRDKAVLAGARGIVGKEEPPENILKAIEKVNSGELWLDRSATGRIFVEFSRRLAPGSQGNRKSGLDVLTPREQQIVRLLTSEPGTSITDIAKKIHTSEHTLRNHLTSVYNKLGVKSRLQLHLFVSKQRTD